VRLGNAIPPCQGTLKYLDRLLRYNGGIRPAFAVSSIHLLIRFIGFDAHSIGSFSSPVARVLSLESVPTIVIDCHRVM
jgi:hypothetical protein